MTADSAIIDRLRDAAGRIDVDLTLDRILRPAPPVSRPTSARAPRIFVAAACVALVAGLGVALSTGRGSETSVSQSPAGWTPPLPVPRNAPEPGDWAAHVPDPPSWLGELGPGRRTGALRTGHWVTTAIGRPTTDGWAAPITVSAFDGAWTALDDAFTVQIDGRSYLQARIGDWQALVTTTQPALAAYGNVDQGTLHGVLATAQITTSGDQFSVAIGEYPADYAEMVPPRVLAGDTTPRRTLAEVSDWTDLLLLAAATGADLTEHTIGTTTGWSGTTTANPIGPVTFLVWSPRPGVLFEIDSTGPGRTIDDLTQLATTTTAISATDWDEIYSG
jgi:hypothetical protein